MAAHKNLDLKLPLWLQSAPSSNSARIQTLWFPCTQDFNTWFGASYGLTDFPNAYLQARTCSAHWRASAFRIYTLCYRQCLLLHSFYHNMLTPRFRSQRFKGFRLPHRKASIAGQIPNDRSGGHCGNPMVPCQRWHPGAVSLVSG